jgi:mono/diheme cytochrome c family protein
MLRTNADDKARLHALWTLDGLRQADRATIEAALTDSSPPVRAAAIRIAEPMLAQRDTALQAAVMHLIADRNATVRRQLAASVGELPAPAREDALADVVAHGGDDPVVADLVVSALRGRELAFLERLLASRSPAEARIAPSVRALARAIVVSREAEQVQRVLALAGESSRTHWQRLALLDGARPAAGQRGGFVVQLPRAPTGLIATMTSADTALRSRAAEAALSLNWPGKNVPAPPVKPFTAAERLRYAAGQQQYLATCAGCHQARGTGLAGVAKPLVGSPWVLGIPERLVRIVLHGKEGTMLMPPIGASLTSQQIASVLTYIRRSWGNSASAIDATTVDDVRGATAGRSKPWTDEELQRVRR